MNRFRISEKQIKKVKQYLKDGKTDSVPKWGLRFKDKLKVVGNILKYDDKTIIPREKVNDYLRKRLYDKDADLQHSRDSAHYQLLKDTVGVTRRTLMEFLRSQRTLGETRPQVQKPTSTGGRKLKKNTKNIFETDLIFIKKAELVKNNPRFDRKMDNHITYCLCTVDKLTGLTQLSEVKTKAAKVVTPKVKEHVTWLAKKLNVDLKHCTIHADGGDEFDHDAFTEIVPETKIVKTGVSVEAKNRQVQQYFYRILKNRQAITVANALKKSQKLVNNCYNRVQKRTPLESCELSRDERLKHYNDNRSTYKNTEDRELQVGDYVRLLVRDPKKNFEYKSYKNKTWTKRVHEVTHRNKKKRPIKYRVNGKWYTIDQLLKSAPRDKESEKIIKARDKEQTDKDIAEAKKLNEELEKERAELLKKYENNPKKKKQLEKLQENRAEQDAIDKLLDEQEKKEDKLAGKKLKHKPAKFVNKAEVDEDYVPEEEQKAPSPKKKVKHKSLSKKARVALIRKFRRLQKQYESMSDADKKTAKGKQLRQQGRMVVQEIKDKIKIHKLDLDVF